MQYLELLAPARNKQIGIAAIDCGADAVYIAGPDFGARKDAGNPVEDIKELCEYAHRFAVRVFVTFNTLFRDDEKEEVHRQMLLCQQAGADAFIIREPQICSWEDITIPLHASTQCAIRDLSAAQYYRNLGCSRVILERELSLDDIKAISQGVDCEIEFFVHGALCVCYSGECRLSEFIDGRSADRGECIQACRSLYDLIDERGRVLLKNKAILSLKDYNLLNRLEELSQAGVSSFKIEGRLKNISYVRNVVRSYDLALNNLVSRFPQRYRRASFGRISEGFTPDTDKTFNRGYTELWLDGKRGKWSSMNAPKSMGELVGRVERIGPNEIQIQAASKDIRLHNGDGFAFATSDGVSGFRADLCQGMKILGKNPGELKEGMMLYRNLNTEFEKTLETQLCRREIPVRLDVEFKYGFEMEISANTQDGRCLQKSISIAAPTASNPERMRNMLQQQLSKRSEFFSFELSSLVISTPDGTLPLLSAAQINSIRRDLAKELSELPCKAIELANYRASSAFVSASFAGSGSGFGSGSGSGLGSDSVYGSGLRFDSGSGLCSSSGSGLGSASGSGSGSASASASASGSGIGLGSVSGSDSVSVSGSGSVSVPVSASGSGSGSVSVPVFASGSGSGSGSGFGSGLRFDSGSGLCSSPGSGLGSASGSGSGSVSGSVANRAQKSSPSQKKSSDFPDKKGREDELMRTKYCVRYELGLCPRYQGAKNSGKLYLLNNGRKFELGFDCCNCEMTLKAHF